MAQETDRNPHVPNKVRAQEQAAWEKGNADVVDADHTTVEPSEADYKKARTVGIGNEPELPPGKVENGAVSRAQVATDARSTQAVSRARSAGQPSDKS
jgi:hypothetical protein